MWKVPVLLFVLGSASIWVLAEGASLEDSVVTPVVKDGVGTQGLEDHTEPTDANGKPSESTDLTTRVPSTESTTKNNLEDSLPTHISTIPDQSTTVTEGTTGHSMERMEEGTQTTVENDGLATSTLVGIIIGVLVAVGLVGAIILVVVRKMSGRYSP